MSTVTGFEPATVGFEVQRAIQLRHTVLAYALLQYYAAPARLIEKGMTAAKILRCILYEPMFDPIKYSVFWKKTKPLVTVLRE